MFYTVSTHGIEETFDTIEQATQAWIDAGSPKEVGSSVWITEHDGVETIRTITIA